MSVASLYKDFGHSELQWKEYGNPNGDLLFFLHGYPDSPSTWDRQVEYFSKEYFCLTPFNRGVGEAGAKASHSSHRRDSLVMDLLALAKDKNPQGIRNVFCIGHDLGAPLAARFARLLGEQLAGLILINGISLSQMRGRLSQPAQLLKSWYIYPILLPGLSEMMVRLAPQWLLRHAEKYGGLPHELAEEGLRSPQQLLAPLKQYREYFWEMWESSNPVSERIDRPLLMLFGNKDPFLMCPTMDEARALGHDSQVRILQGNHWLHREKADEVNHFIHGFIKSSLPKK